MERVRGLDILLLDNQLLMRKGMKWVLDKQKYDGKVEEASNVEEALGIVESKQIDVALIEWALGAEDGFEFIRKVRQWKYPLKIIIVSSVCRQQELEKASQLAVDGYVVKEAFLEEIVFAVKRVMANGQFYSPEILNQVKQQKKQECLTKREQEVLYYLQQGYTNMRIANTLCISESTVKKHVSNILAKRNLKNRIEAAIYNWEI